MDNWRKLNDLCLRITDGSHFSPPGKKDGFPMLSVKDMRENSFSYEDCKYISQDDYKSLVKADCKPLLNDILIAKDGSYLKHIFVIEKEREEVILSSIGILRPDLALVNPYYIKYYLHSDFVKKQVARKYVSGSALPRIILKNFGEILVPFIKKSKQDEIVNILRTLDAKIELNNRINAELEAIAKTLYDYWFVQFDFPNAKGKPYKSSGGKMVWNEELKREIPQGWDNGTLSDISELIRGVSYSANDIREANDEDVIPILRATNISGNVIDLEKMVYVNKINVGSDQLLKKYDILITMSSGSIEHIGKNGFFYFNDDVAYGAFCAKLVAKEGFHFYLYSYTQSDFMFTTIKNECLGTNINNLNSKMVNGFKIVLPANNLIVEFNKKVSPVFEKIGNNLIENKLLSELRDWLLPMLMNGQVKVK